MRALIFCLAMGLASPLAASPDTSVPLGVGGGGWLTALAVDPTDAQIVYVGGDLTGVFRSLDGASSFHPINRGLSSYLIHEIVIDPSAPETVYLATSDGVFKSTDRGDHWTLERDSAWPDFQPGFMTEPINALALDPSNSKTIYAGGGYGQGDERDPVLLSNSLYKSIDGGESWRRMNSGTSTIPSGAIFFHLRVHPQKPNVLLAATRRGLYKSTDGGINWVRKDQGLPAADVRSVEFAPPSGTGDSRSWLAYCTVYSPDQAQPWVGGVYKSLDEGESWQPARNGLGFNVTGPGHLTSNYPELYVDPTDPLTIYTGNWGSGPFSGVYKTQSGGASWTQLTDSIAQPYNPSPHTTVMAIAASEPETVYFGNSMHLFKSINGGVSWNPVSTRRLGPNLYESGGIETTVVGDIAVDPHDASLIYLGYQDTGLFRSTDGGSSFAQISAWQDVLDVQIDPELSSTVWLALGETQAVSPGQLYRKTADTDWTLISGAGSGLPSGAMRSITLDPSSPPDDRTLYVSFHQQGVYKSTDNGTSWSEANNGLDPNLDLRRLTLCEQNPEVLYAASWNQVYRTVDGGESWTSRAFLAAGNLRTVKVHPEDCDTVFIGNFGAAPGASSFWRSTHGGANPQLIMTTDWIGSVAFDPFDRQIVYAGAMAWGFYDRYVTEGLYRSTDGGATWQVLDVDLPFRNIYTIEVSPAAPNTLFLGTAGGGAFVVHDWMIFSDGFESGDVSAWSVVKP